MPHHNSVFHSVLKLVPWNVFDTLVAEHRSDARIRALSTKSQFIALAFAQLHGASSLRAIETGLRAQRGKLHQLGARPVRRSTLADANAKRPAAVFEGICNHLIGTADRGLRRGLGRGLGGIEQIYLVDASVLPLNSLSRWARFSQACHGAKLHVLYDDAAGVPVYYAVTSRRVSDNVAALDMPITPAATYVFDLGYYDFRWWARINDAGCRIVTRLKQHTPLRLIERRAVPPDGSIVADCIGLLPERQGYSRRNPMGQVPVREIRVRTDRGKLLRLVSNDLSADAQEIADLYRRRWHIELFFRSIKQALDLRHFLGASQNAVRIQVAVALTVCLLLRAAQSLQTALKRPLDFLNAVRALLWEPRRLSNMLDPRPPNIHNPKQLSFFEMPT